MLDSLDGAQWVEALGFYYLEPWHFDPRLPVALPGEDARHPLYGLTPDQRARLPAWTREQQAAKAAQAAPERAPEGLAVSRPADKPFPDKALPPEQMLQKVMAANKEIGGVTLWTAPPRPPSMSS